MPSFNWSPSFSSSESSKPRVSSARFGDGYEQRVRMGLQTDPKTWQLEFNNRTNLERDEIRAFLESRGGAEAFNWTTPWGQTDWKWVCEEWNIDPSNCNNNQIRATFRQVYDWSLITEVSFGRPAWDSGYSQFRPGALTTSTPPVAAKQWVTSATTFAAGVVGAAKQWVTSATTFAPGVMSGVEVDPYFSQVSLLLHFNENMIDSSSNAFTATVYGDAQVSGSNSKFGSGSLTLDGNGDYITFPESSAFAFGTGDFTVECWVYLGSGNTNNGLFTFGDAGSGLALAIYNNNWTLSAYGGNGVQLGSPVIGAWQHIAITRSGTNLRLFINGTRLNDTLSNSTNFISNQLKIGYYYSTSYSINAFIDEFRVTKGAARYTSNFTPPTAPFPNA